MEGTKIEVTVQSLEGVMFDDHMLPMGRGGRPAELSVTVTFSGSAEDMEVGSSTLCMKSGALMIESEPIDTLEELPLMVEWEEKRVQGQKRGLPHLTMRLPCRDPGLPSAPLVQANRGSRLVKELPSIDEIDTHSTVTDVTASTCGTGHPSLSSSSSSGSRSSRMPVARSSSALWSNSGAAMPEIIELTTRIKVQGKDSLEDEKGTAYLVVFGHDPPGTYLMDLPIRQHQTRKKRAPVYISDNAMLRVRIRVYPRKRTAIQTADSVATNVPASSITEINMSRSMMAEQIVPLVERIRRNEEKARERREAQKRAMDIHVPAHGTEVGDDSSLFCNGPWDWDSVLETLASAVTTPCSGRSVCGGKGSVSVADSSIASRESMVTWK